MIETWRWIKGFKSLYKVSDLGRVKSVPRFVLIEKDGYAPYYIKIKGRIMALTKDKGGYLIVVLYKKGKPYCRKVHRMVAEAFIPNLRDLPEVNHVDSKGTKTNNRWDNLEWSNHKGNMAHAMFFGLTQKPPVKKGSTNGRSKLTEAKVVRIIERLAKGVYLKRIAFDENVSLGLISQIKNRRIWKHVWADYNERTIQ